MDDLGQGKFQRQSLRVYPWVRLLGSHQLVEIMKKPDVLSKENFLSFTICIILVSKGGKKQGSVTEGIISYSKIQEKVTWKLK